MLFSQGRRTHLPISKHWTWAGQVLSPHPPLPCEKSHYPSVFSLVEDGCPPTLKYSLRLCFLWMLQSPGTGLNLWSGSSPVLRPSWLAIQWACQARGTLWLWRAGTGEDERETSSSIPTLVSRLTSPVHGPLASWLSPLLGLTCNPSPVQLSIYHFLESCFYQKIKIRICYSIWVRGSYKTCCQCPGHPDQQQWLSQEREKRVFNGRHENQLSRTVSRSGIPPGYQLLGFSILML